MNRWLIAGAVLALVPLASAQAADIPLKAPAPPPVSWTGAYVGASVGARWNDGTLTTSDPVPTNSIGTFSFGSTPSSGIHDTAARFGGYAGFNYQIAPTWVVGVEGYGGYANNTQTFSVVPGAPISVAGVTTTNNPRSIVKASWDAGVRGRLGYLVTPSVLVYATGGGAWQSVSLQSFCPSFGGATDWCSINEGTPKVSKVMAGWTVGGGAELRLNEHWFVRVEYQYADYGSFSNTFFTANTAVPFDDRYLASVKMRTHTANIGIAYKF